MKPFNLEEYLKNPSRKVVTRDGRSVRIICTDAKSRYPVIALAESRDGTTEQFLTLTKFGKYFGGSSNSNDLYFVPEKHEGWINIFKCDCVGVEIYETQDLAKDYGIHHSGYVDTIKIEWEE